jgi:hypothetical protein
MNPNAIWSWVGLVCLLCVPAAKAQSRHAGAEPDAPSSSRVAGGARHAVPLPDALAVPTW